MAEIWDFVISTRLRSVGAGSAVCYERLLSGMVNLGGTERKCLGYLASTPSRRNICISMKIFASLRQS